MTLLIHGDIAVIIFIKSETEDRIFLSVTAGEAVPRSSSIVRIIMSFNLASASV